jgi:hypothetical protein
MMSVCVCPLSTFEPVDRFSKTWCERYAIGMHPSYFNFLVYNNNMEDERS